MQLDSLSLASLDIPFKVAFQHSSATRDKTETAWVVLSAEGLTGHGESCPRRYVTGEDMASVERFFQHHQQDLKSTISDLRSLKQWVTSHEEAINQNPAAWCAIELAMLDLLAKENFCTVEQLLGMGPVPDEFTYSGVLGDGEIEIFSGQVEQYAALQMSDFKIKLSADAARNLEKIEALKKIIPGSRLRLDANNLWQDSAAAIEHLALFSSEYFAIEEPLAKADFAGMSAIAKTLDVRIILDESFTNASHFEPLRDHPEYWIVNLRVSKVGGLLRAIDLANMAKQSGIGCIVGAQVGETSLLTRAGMVAALACHENLLAQEGAFGLYLLEHDVCAKSLMFGKQGKIITSEHDCFNKPGFGLDIDI